MKKREIVFLTSFFGLNVYLDTHRCLINLISKKFKYVYFLNSDNLNIFPDKFLLNNKIDKKIFLKFPKKIKFTNPKDFRELDIFFKNKNPLVVNNIGRGFALYKLLYYFKSRNISQISIDHVGNIQASILYWQGIGFGGFKHEFAKKLSRLISRVLIFAKIFSQIDVRFISNKKRYDAFIKNSKKNSLLKFSNYYKEYVLVKSKFFDEIEMNKKKIYEKYILLLDMDPNYREMKLNWAKFDEKLVKKHYEKLNDLLLTLSRKFKKEAIVSIHPLYDLKKISERFKKLKVKKMETEELIKKSFLILFFDSSAIISAVVLKKKIICLQSDLFKGKKYNSDLYKNTLGLKAINIFKKVTIKKSSFIKDLNRRTMFYDNYLKNYLSSNLRESGSKQVIKYIKNRYF